MRPRKRLKHAVERQIESAALRWKPIEDEQQSKKHRPSREFDELPFSDLPDDEEYPDDAETDSDDAAGAHAKERVSPQRLEARRHLYYSRALRDKSAARSVHHASGEERKQRSTGEIPDDPEANEPASAESHDSLSKAKARRRAYYSLALRDHSATQSSVRASPGKNRQTEAAIAPYASVPEGKLPSRQARQRLQNRVYDDDERKESAEEHAIDALPRTKSRQRAYYNSAFKDQPTESFGDSRLYGTSGSNDDSHHEASTAAHHLRQRWQGEIYRGAEAEKKADRETFKVLQTKETARTESISEEVKRHRLRFGDEVSGMIRGAGRIEGHAARLAARSTWHYTLREFRSTGEDNVGAAATADGMQAGEHIVRVMDSPLRTMSASVREQSLHMSPRKTHAETAHIDKAAQVEHAKKERIKAFQRKRRHKAAVAAAVRKKRETVVTAGGFVDSASTIISIPAKAKKAAMSFMAEHKGMVIGAAFLSFLFLLFALSLTSMASLVQGSGTSILETTYLSSDEDIYAAENYYRAREEALEARLRDIQLAYPGYDEYVCQSDIIEHDPYHLISHLQAHFGAFTFNDELKRAMNTLFVGQYAFQVSEGVETRTRQELATDTYMAINPETGELEPQAYQYEISVPYQHRILYATVVNVNFERPARQNLTDAELVIYDALNLTFGNRDYLFEKYSTSGASPGMDYTIPPEALSDEKFANMIHEAEKYLGRAYVLGGTTPRTGFDCSGFACWVINNCGNGWSMETMPARYLCNYCIRISPEEARPGDLIFFEKTSSVVGASHVGIYVGDGMMIHAGDPIKYSTINTRFYKEHFLCFGRLPFYDD